MSVNWDSLTALRSQMPYVASKEAKTNPLYDDPMLFIAKYFDSDEGAPSVGCYTKSDFAHADRLLATMEFVAGYVIHSTQTSQEFRTQQEERLRGSGMLNPMYTGLKSLPLREVGADMRFLLFDFKREAYFVITYIQSERGVKVRLGGFNISDQIHPVLTDFQNWVAAGDRPLTRIYLRGAQW